MSCRCINRTPPTQTQYGVKHLESGQIEWPYHGEMGTREWAFELATRYNYVHNKKVAVPVTREVGMLIQEAW
ncbi:hypothetical protein SEA_NANOSMITE_64 [Mycobacterium phage Nanosmite]|nr:hypothetical protein SEA_NANOSMITE_64 [Mycobacterium phage Nanosmite]